MLRIMCMVGIIGAVAQCAEGSFEPSVMDRLVETLAQRHRAPPLEYYGGFSAEKQKAGQEHKYAEKDESNYQQIPANNPVRPHYLENDQHLTYIQVQESATTKPNYSADRYNEAENSKPQQKFCSQGKPEEIKPSFPTLPYLPVVIYNMGPIHPIPTQQYKPSISAILESFPINNPTKYTSENNDAVVIESEETDNDQENQQKLHISVDGRSTNKDKLISSPTSQPEPRIRRRINYNR